MLKTRLPAELTDRIIDHLYSDKRALATCSLVCRTWLPASRYHFFQTDMIRLSEHNINSLTELLDSPASTFFGHVLNVKIFAHDPVERPNAIGILDTISRHLPRLKIKSLHLSGVKWDIMDADIEGIFRCLAIISALKMTDVMFSVPNQFIKFITSFASLERLSLRKITLQEVDIAHITPFTLSPLLRFVEMTLNSHLPWFLSAARFPPLNYLKLALITPEYLDAIQALLQSSGPSLRDLNLAFVDIGGGGRVNLRQNTRLRYLRISGILGTILLYIVSHIDSFDLETIHFKLAGSNTRNIKTVEWKQVAQVLTQPGFVKLQNVDLDMDCYSDTESHDCSCVGWVAYIRARTSILDNILHLSVCHFD